MGLFWRLLGESQLSSCSLCVHMCVWTQYVICVCVCACVQVMIHILALLVLLRLCSFGLTGEGGGIMSATLFPSITMKNVNWGHIEQCCSRNIKGLLCFVQWCAVCLQYEMMCIREAAWQPTISRDIYAVCMCIRAQTWLAASDK